MRWEKTQVTTWLRAYERPGEPVFPTNYTFVGFWSGIHSLQSCTGPGSGSAEAHQHMWQAQLTKVPRKEKHSGGPGPQWLYKGWAEDFDWAKSDPLSTHSELDRPSPAQRRCARTVRSHSRRRPQQAGCLWHHVSFEGRAARHRSHHRRHRRRAWPC